MATNQTSEAKRSEETSASFGFEPDPIPFDGSTATTLHGLTHDDVTRVLGDAAPSGIFNKRYICLRGPHGSLSGYIEVESFQAVCRALGVQS